MRKTEIIAKLAMGVALAAWWTPAVLAQDNSADEAEETDSNVIIVTARRAEENLQNVPLTVDVVTDKKLKELNLFNGSDLTAVVPGLTFSPSSGQSTPVLALRGAARGEAGGRLDPTVQTYLNEAPVSDVLVYQALYDIGQVEVLRGPQGTLRGRPSAAGAITFTTKRPDLTRVTGYVSLAASTRDQLRAEGAVGVPIINDVLAVRLAGIIDRNDNDGVRSLNFGRKPYQELESWRASVRFQPADILDINVMYQDFKSERASLYQVAGTGYRGPSMPANPFATIVQPGFNGPAISPFDRLSVTDGFAIRDEHHQNLIGQIDLDLGTHSLSYVGEYARTQNINFGSNNITHTFPVAYPDPQLKSLDGVTKLVTQELRLETTGADFWDYGVGGYYERSKSQNLVEAIAAYLPGTFGNPRRPNLANLNYNYNLVLTGNFPVNYTNRAIYANSTFHITPDTDIFVGARHVWYTQSSDQIGNLSGGLTATGSPVAFCGFIPNQGAGPAFPSTFIPGQCDLPLPPRNLFVSNPLVKKETAWVYNASLTHRFTNDLTAYATFGHSWRPSSNNLNLSGTRPTVLGFANTNSETSDNFEGGVKMQLLDRRLTVNLAAFYQKYKGFLFSARGVPYVNNTDGELPAQLKIATVAALTTNADAEVKGFDIELAYRASPQFSISGNVNYARGRLSNALVPCNDSNADGISDGGISTLASFGGGVRDVNYCKSSAATANQADWSASMQSEYNLPVSNHVDGYIRALVSYTPKNNFAPGATEANPFPVSDFALVNLFLGIRSNSGQWDIGAYARNLTNVQKQLSQGIAELGTPSEAQSQLGLTPSSGYRFVGLTPRREFGATFRFNW